MTEAEWLACTEPREMLEALQAGGLLPERKARLFAAACCRRIWPLLDEGPARRAVEVAERYADGRADEVELAGAVLDADAAPACCRLRRNSGSAKQRNECRNTSLPAW
jgi:hypothetical protein